MTNQKWELFKYELKKQIEEEYRESLPIRIDEFKESISSYKNIEIPYNSTKYKKISKLMTDFNLRDDRFETVYQVAKRLGINFEYRNNNIVFL